MVKRIIAIATVLLILGLVIASFVLGIMGSPYFWGVFFATFMFPIIVWAMLLIYKQLSNKNKQ